MADRKTLQIQQISAHPGPIAGKGMSREPEVCKLIDTTTCIGCKACEVACVEWNDMPFQTTYFDNTYQTMPDTNWNYWNLIKFNEDQHADGSFAWLMRKHQCMHCEDPGVCVPVLPTALSCNMPTALSTSSRKTASVANSVFPDVPSTSPNSTLKRRRSISARCVPTALEPVSNLLASNRVRPDACISAPKTT